jgi:hypothetical protein
MNVSAVVAPAVSAPVVEKVAPGERCTERYRTDPRVKRFLLAKRPPGEDVQRLISYRTECRVAIDKAERAKAPHEIWQFIFSEYLWAVRELRARQPQVLKRLGYPRREWSHLEQQASPQADLFAGPRK